MSAAQNRYDGLFFHEDWYVKLNRFDTFNILEICEASPKTTMQPLKMMHKDTMKLLEKNPYDTMSCIIQRHPMQTMELLKKNPRDFAALCSANGVDSKELGAFKELLEEYSRVQRMEISLYLDINKNICRRAEGAPDGGRDRLMAFLKRNTQHTMKLLQKNPVDTMQLLESCPEDTVRLMAKNPRDTLFMMQCNLNKWRTWGTDTAFEGGDSGECWFQG